MWSGRFLLPVIGVVSLVGASAHATATSTPPSSPVEASVPADSFPITLQTADGDVTIPAKPERVVTLFGAQAADVLLSLGITPVASGPFYAPAIAEAAADVTELQVPIDVEQVAAQDPDLIIGFYSDNADTYDQLSQIAPTLLLVLAGDDGSDGFSPDLVTDPDAPDYQQLLKLIGPAVGETARAEQVAADLDAQAAALRSELDGAQVALVRPGEDNIQLLGPRSRVGRLLTEAGIEVMPFPDAADTSQTRRQDEFANISLEQIPTITAPNIIVLVSAQDAPEMVALEANPLWQQLPAVQAGDVDFGLGQNWIWVAPLAAEAVLDELAGFDLAH